MLTVSSRSTRVTVSVLVVRTSDNDRRSGGCWRILWRNCTSTSSGRGSGSGGFSAGVWNVRSICVWSVSIGVRAGHVCRSTHEVHERAGVGRGRCRRPQTTTSGTTRTLRHRGVAVRSRVTVGSRRVTVSSRVAVCRASGRMRVQIPTWVAVAVSSRMTETVGSRVTVSVTVGA